MFRSRAILSNISLLTENWEPMKPSTNRKGVTLFISGIETPQDRMRLENKFELIPGELGIKYLNVDDKKYYENQIFLNEKLQHERLVIEWKHDELEDISDINNPLFKTFIALRLLKEGPVFIKYLYTINEDKALLVKHSNFIVPNAYMDYHQIYDYKLKEEENQSFKQIFKLLNKEKKLDDNIDLGLDRFQSTYFPKPARDVLLDIMIAFEALFLTGYRGSNKGQTLAIACSKLLGKTRSERKAIKETLSKFYKIRNYIVHGSSYNGDEIEENFYTLRNYLRRSIIILLR